MPILTPLRPIKLGPRADMPVKELRKELFIHGMEVTWELAMECPCRRVTTLTGGAETVTGQTGEKRPNCPACLGRGWVYHSKQPSVALITRAETNPERYAIYGVRASGMIGITSPPECLPGFMDRFTLKNNVIVYSDVVTRATTVEGPRYPIVKRTITVGTQADPTVPLSKTIGVLYLRKTDTSGVINGGELTEGVDFDVTAEGKIDWTKGIALGTAPAIGAWYALAYYAHPVYVVLDLPFTFRDTMVNLKLPNPELANLPVHVAARLEWLEVP